MKTVPEIRKKWRLTVSGSLLVLALATGCSSVKESGEPDTVNTSTEITTDAQRKAVYENGGNVAPQNANPIPSSDKLGLDEKSSEINRKRNIEDGSNTNSPANTPTDERPRQIRNTGSGSDTIRR